MRVHRLHFKQPDPAYDCTHVKSLFSDLAQAADEISADLAEYSP